MTTLPALTSPVAGRLHRRGAPVTVDRVAVGIVWAVGPDLGDDALVACDRGIVRRALAELPMDLDESGRDIAARWLAGHHGLTVGATAPGWEWDDDWKAWMLGRPFAHRFASKDLHATRCHVVPGISAVTDPAEALRLACLAAVSR